MYSDIFPVQSSQLDTKALLKAMNERYEVNVENCRLWNPGVNDVYILWTNIGTLYLRVSHAARYSQNDYEEEIFIINTLHKFGIPAATPIADKNDNYLWEIHAPEGTRYAVLFHEARHTTTDRRENQLYNMGVMAAKIHEISDEQKFNVSREPIEWHQLVEHPLERIIESFVERQADYEFLKTSSKSLWEFIERKLPKKAPYYGYCHGDMHGGNVIFDGDKPQIIDFDCMGYGYRAYDICIYAWNETFGHEDYIDSEEWKKYIDGYCNVRELEEAELSCIPAFAALRHIWLIGLHLDGTDINNPWSWMDDNYFNHQIKMYKLWYNRAFTI